MNHPETPVYYALSSVCQYDGTTTVLAICEDMDAVMYRIKQCYTTCGDEYVINAYHLTTAFDAAAKYNEQVVSRREYQAKEKEKDDKVKAYDALSDEEKYLQSQKEFEKMEDNRIEREKIMNEDFMEDKLKELEDDDVKAYDESFDAASYT